jgi:hypothetical protein
MVPGVSLAGISAYLLLMEAGIATSIRAGTAALAERQATCLWAAVICKMRPDFSRGARLSHASGVISLIGFDRR